MTAIIKHGVALLEKGGRHHLRIQGKALTDSLPQMKDFNNPILDVRINGRGKEGSAYAVKLFTDGNQDPDLSIFGRVDYRAKSPILQLRGDYLYGQDYASGRITIRTGEKNSLNNSINSKDNTLHLKSDSNALTADIFANKNALKNLTELLNKLGLKINLEEELLRTFTGMNDFNDKLATRLKALNPFNIKPQQKASAITKSTPEVAKIHEREEIKINPHEYFKEDSPATEGNPLTKVNQTITKQDQLQEVKKQLQNDELQINLLKNRLKEVEKEFKEAKPGSDSISKVSLMNMLREDLANAERAQERHSKKFEELLKK